LCWSKERRYPSADGSLLFTARVPVSEGIEVLEE
jgi:hypothetical protein